MSHDISNIKEPKDVPKYLRPYIRFSMKFFDAKKNEIQKVICSYTDMVIAETDLESKKLKQNILDGAKESMQNLEDMKTRGELVEDYLCNKAGIAVDWTAYHTDKAAVEFATIEEMEALLPKADTEELKKKVEEAIEQHKRFAFSHRKKAGGIGWNRQAKVSRALMKKGE